MLLDNGTVALALVLAVLGFLVWAGRQRAPVPGEGAGGGQIATRLDNVERELKELRRGVARANTQAEEAKRIAESVAPVLSQIQWTLQQVAADVTVLRAANAGAEAAERTYAQQRQAAGGVTVNTAAPGMQFQGNATIEGPAIGGTVGRLEPPGKHERTILP